MQTLAEFPRPRGRGIPSGALTVFGLFFLRTVKSGRMAFALLLATLPLLLVLSVGVLFELPERARKGSDLFGFLGLTAYLQFLTPYISLLFGSYAVAEEVEGKTAVFLFTRPVPRGALALGKWLLAALCATGIVLVSLAACFVVLGLKPEGEGLLDRGDLLRQLALACGLSCLAYTALFTALGAWIKRALLVGLLITSIWEVVVANVPAPIRGATVMHYARILLHRSVSGMERVREFFVQGSDETLPTSSEAVAVLLGITVVGVVLGYVAVIVRQYTLDR